MPFNFGAAAPEEEYVYGACRPAHPGGAPGTTVDDWLAFVRERGIERVCCLLDEEHLRGYDDLLDRYGRAFGARNVHHAPIGDYGLVDGAVFRNGILPFLRGSVDADRRVVVHCSAGSGRTGHVLVGWLVADRGYGVESAIGTVEGMGRNPLEAPGTEASDLADLFER
jgi:protein-tyrosine phosphatase